MWELKTPKQVKLITAILAADDKSLKSAVGEVQEQFGKIDLQSDVWNFTQTDYYKKELGDNILRQFVTIEKLIDPGGLAQIKHKTNDMEQKLASRTDLQLPRPVNIDPGIIEPSKLILASTKNFAHRIYIGQKMYAEVTLLFDKGIWRSMPYTFPDYKQSHYHDFFSKVREKLVEQLKTQC